MQLHVQHEMRKLSIPGIAWSLTWPEALAGRHMALGDANCGRAYPVEGGSVFRVGSLSKVATALAVGLLVQRGRVRLDDDIREYLPETSGPALPIRSLLGHAAGLARGRYGGAQDRAQLALESRLRVAAEAAGLKYSNLGYALLGELIGASCGRPYAEFVRTDILRPLGMDSSDFGDDPRLDGRRVTGYQSRQLWEPPDPGERLRPAQVLGMHPAAAGLQCSAADYIRLLSEWLGRGPGLLDAGLRREMLLVQQRARGSAASWTCMMQALERDGDVLLRHRGTVGGCSGVAMLSPTRGVAGVMLANLDAVAGRLEPLLRRELAGVPGGPAAGGARRRSEPIVAGHYRGPVPLEIEVTSGRLRCTVQGRQMLADRLAPRLFRLPDDSIGGRHLAFDPPVAGRCRSCCTQLHDWVLACTTEDPMPDAFRSLTGTYHCRTLRSVRLASLGGHLQMRLGIERSSRLLPRADGTFLHAGGLFDGEPVVFRRHAGHIVGFDTGGMYFTRVGVRERDAREMPVDPAPADVRHDVGTRPDHIYH